MMRGIAGRVGKAPCDAASANSVSTSWYSGSPTAPGSLVRSSTAIALVVFGSAAKKWSGENGRNRWTCTTPTFSPCAVRKSTVSRAVSAPEPMTTSTRSASGAPK